MTTVRLAAIIYGLLSAVAFVWSHVAGRGTPLFDPKSTSWILPVVGGLIGLAGGLLTVAISRFLVAHQAWARSLYWWFADVLGPISQSQVLAIAIFSAAGEELFFRGAMQPSLGLWPTTLLFALLHVPPRFQHWPWTLMAGLLGLAFGYLTLWSGSILGAVVAHFVVNWLNLTYITRHPLHPEEKLPGEGTPPSMSGHEDPPLDRDRAGSRHADSAGREPEDRTGR
jgi:membrane protease YdiL (CAAX protease family)